MALMKTYFAELKDSELESVLMILDSDGDGRISRGELKAWYLGSDADKLKEGSAEAPGTFCANRDKWYPRGIHSSAQEAFFVDLQLAVRLCILLPILLLILLWILLWILRWILVDSGLGYAARAMVSLG